MKNIFLRIKNSRGDTIVEVLIAIAIVSLVLAGAFASTRRSASATRTAQEQGEALKLAESQVEQIRVATETGTPNLASAPASFCISGFDTPASTDPPCKSGLYRMAITKPPIPPKAYVVRVTWNRLGGGTNNVELYYKTQ